MRVFASRRESDDTSLLHLVQQCDVVATDWRFSGQSGCRATAAAIVPERRFLAIEES